MVRAVYMHKVHASLSIHAWVACTALPTRGVSFAMQHEGHYMTLLYIAVMRLSYSLLMPAAPLLFLAQANNQEYFTIQTIIPERD